MGQGNEERESNDNKNIHEKKEDDENSKDTFIKKSRKSTSNGIDIDILNQGKIINNNSNNKENDNNNIEHNYRNENNNINDINNEENDKNYNNSKNDYNDNNFNKDNKLSNSEDLGENITENNSEQMSKEGNLFFNNNDDYFTEPWNFKHKIINRKTNFEDN